MKLLFLLLLLVISSGFMISDVFAETRSYNVNYFTIDMPDGFTKDTDPKYLLSYSNPDMFIQVQEFQEGVIVENRDAFLNEKISEAKNICESYTFEKDDFRCAYELFDSYKLTVNEYPTLVIFDQFIYSESTDSEFDDSSEKCFIYFVIDEFGVWKLLGCLTLTTHQQTNSFSGFSESMAFEIIKKSLDSFSLKPFSERAVESFVDATKNPQHYVDRYNNEPDYKKWFDNEFPNITIYEAINVPEGITFVESFAESVNTQLVESKIPSWAKNIFGWYAQDLVSEDELLSAIKYLINEKILIVD